RLIAFCSASSSSPAPSPCAPKPSRVKSTARGSSGRSGKNDWARSAAPPARINITPAHPRIRLRCSMKLFLRRAFEGELVAKRLLGARDEPLPAVGIDERVDRPRVLQRGELLGHRELPAVWGEEDVARQRAQR